MSPNSTNNLHTNLELRDQLNSFQSNILEIQEQAQKLIDKGVGGAQTVCQNIVKSVNKCSNIKRAADINIEKITPDGCSSYSLTRLVCNKKRAVLIGSSSSSTDSPHLRTRYVDISDAIRIPLPLNSNVYSAAEACGILINNNGKGTYIIQYMIANNLIPVKKSMMYRILNTCKNSSVSDKNIITWNSRGQPQIISDNSLQTAIKYFKRGFRRGILRKDMKLILKKNLPYMLSVNVIQP